jgi:hypothetical protein
MSSIDWIPARSYSDSDLNLTLNRHKRLVEQRY